MGSNHTITNLVLSKKSPGYVAKAETHLCKAANPPVVSQAAQLADWVQRAGHLVLSVQTSRL